tara:strand:+ start:53 stop:415 length:363 start_codon:yes stop_codon:yes gene_type:complete
MRIEVLSRIWIADRKHSRCNITNVINLHEYELSEKSPFDLIRYIKNITSIIFKKSVNELKQIILIDPNIHDTHIGYLIIVAYLVLYGNIPYDQALKQIQTKTLQFHLTDIQKRILNKLKK